MHCLKHKQDMIFNMLIDESVLLDKLILKSSIT